MTPGIHESRERYALFVPPRSAVPVARERRAPGPADPKAPWTSDHPWRPAGMLPDYSRDTRGSMLRRIALVVLIALFNIALPAAPFALKLVLLVLDLVALLILIDLILKIAHELHHPRTRMRWTTFPAFLGGRLEGTLLVRPAQYVFSALQVRLRCVQDERNERHPEDAGLEPHVIYEQSFEAVPPGETLTELPLSFQLPEDLPGTHLDRAEATYWQVAVRIPVTGPDIEAVFLAPVYERDHP
ncbi:MAG TPA: hypothetical protein VHC97_12745 [Thermoanaerobaculia bacterium]|nr:hypothetical protein [Thermoanaerobaculia bacterium]